MATKSNPWTGLQRPTTRMEKEHVALLRGRTSARTLGNRYELKRVIGEDGTAEIHAATDLVLEREVAVKLLRRDLAIQAGATERFRRDALALASVDAPQVVQVHDIGADGEDHYVVMRFVRGRTLGELIAKQGALPPARAVRLAGEILEGLQAIHLQRVIHGGLEADGVLIDWDDRVAIADLGAAADREGDLRTDTHGVAMLIVHMLTGVAPAAGADVSAVVTLLPAAIAAVLRRALDPVVDRRYATARELKKALETAMERISAPLPAAVPAPVTSSMVAPMPAPRGRRVAMPLSIAVSAAGLIAALAAVLL